MSAKLDPIFLDVEATDWPHLGGYPVEIGWASAAGASEFLIRPHEIWTAWSSKAEAIHGTAEVRKQPRATVQAMVQTPIWEMSD